jgi:hypothetical protein
LYYYLSQVDNASCHVFCDHGKLVWVFTKGKRTDYRRRQQHAKATGRQRHRTGKGTTIMNTKRVRLRLPIMLYALVLNWLWLTVWPLTAHAVPLVTPVPVAVGDAGLNDPSCPNLGTEGYRLTLKQGNVTMTLSSNLLMGVLLITLLSACQPIQASPASPEPARVSIPTVTIELGDQGVTVPAELPTGVVAVTVKNSTTTPSVDDEMICE